MSTAPHGDPVIRHYLPGGTENGGGIGRLVEYILLADGKTLRHYVIDTRGPRTQMRSIFPFLRAFGTITADGLLRRATLQHLHIAGRGSTVRKTLLAHWARMWRVPYLLHLHDYDYAADFRRRPGWQRRAIRSAFFNSAQVFVLGRRDAATLGDMLGVPDDRLLILRNCVPDPGGRPARPPSEVSILFLGRLGPRKGVPELIAALADPVVHPTSWHAVLAGDGPLESYRGDIERLGLGDRIALTGWVDTPATADLLRAADILVLPSHAEGFAMAILEGLANGLAVIATQVGAHDEVLVDQQNCLMVNPGDPQGLAHALSRLISDPALRDRLGKAGRNLYLAQFGIDGYVRTLERTQLAAMRHEPRVARSV